MHQTKTAAFKRPPEGGAPSCPQLLGEALTLHGKHQPINHVHSHAQNGELFLVYKNIQETQKTVIRLMKSINGHQIQRHKCPQRYLQSKLHPQLPSSGLVNKEKLA